MNSKDLVNKLQRGETIYLLDGFENAVFRLFFDKKKGVTRSFIKRRGRSEEEISQSSKIVNEAIMGGQIITEKEYGQF